jgi:hypothetical protein
MIDRRHLCGRSRVSTDLVIGIHPFRVRSPSFALLLQHNTVCATHGEIITPTIDSILSMTP